MQSRALCHDPPRTQYVLTTTSCSSQSVPPIPLLFPTFSLPRYQQDPERPPVGRLGPQCLPVQPNCQLTEWEFSLSPDSFGISAAGGSGCRLGNIDLLAEPLIILYSDSFPLSIFLSLSLSFLALSVIASPAAARPRCGHEWQPGGEPHRPLHLRHRHERQQA